MDMDWNKFTLFNYSLVCWNLENLWNRAVSIFFPLSWHLSEKNLLESIFSQNKNWLWVQDFVYKTSQLVRISLLISAITKSFVIFLGKVN